MFFLKERKLYDWLFATLFVRIFSQRFLYFIAKLYPRCKFDRNKGVHPEHFALFDQAIPISSGSRSCPGKPMPQEPIFLNNGFLRSPAGILAFKKYPNSPMLDAYLECQLEGLSYFDKAFRGAAGHQMTYDDIMVAHHRILATGSGGQRNYPVGFSKECSKDVAGNLRHEGGRVAFPVREAKQIKVILRALSDVGCYPDGPWFIKTDGIPEGAVSKAIRIKHGFDIVHPDGKHIPLYFKNMGQCLALLRVLLSESGSMEYKQRKLVLQAVATYFHLGIHAHAFVRINQSLLWSQVNYLLMLMGLQPVHHGDVDLVAAFLDTGHFCRYFESYVYAHGTMINKALRVPHRHQG